MCSYIYIYIYIYISDLGDTWNKCISNMYLEYKMHILYLYLDIVFNIHIIYFVSQHILYFENIYFLCQNTFLCCGGENQ